MDDILLVIHLGHGHIGVIFLGEADKTESAAAHGVAVFDDDLEG